MAIYSLCTTPASRSSGKNAIAMAAYRSGERLLDLQTGQICDYTHKRGVLEKNILFPQGVSFERQKLWNMAERSEKRKDGRIAREILIALPHELEPEARLNLVKEYVQELVNKYQIAVDFSIHAPNDKGDDRNFHAHLLLTTRQITQDGLSEKSELERSDKYLKQHGLKNGKEQILELREKWEEQCNLALKRAGIEEQISAKSYKARNIEQEPTIHLGSAASEMERKGIRTEKGTRNRIIRKINLNRVLRRKRIARQRAWERLTRMAQKLENEIKLEKEQRLKVDHSLSASELLMKNHIKESEHSHTREVLSASELLKRSKDIQKDQGIENYETQLTPEELLEQMNAKTRPEMQRGKNGLDREGY